jgi:hypothetical protein
MYATSWPQLSDVVRNAKAIDRTSELPRMRAQLKRKSSKRRIRRLIAESPERPA